MDITRYRFEIVDRLQEKRMCQWRSLAYSSHCISGTCLLFQQQNPSKKANTKISSLFDGPFHLNTVENLQFSMDARLNLLQRKPFGFNKW